jgi:CheY-like chemotaxis protein
MRRPLQKLASRLAKRLRGRHDHPIPQRVLFVGAPAALGILEPAGLVKFANLEEALAQLGREEIAVALYDQDSSADWRSAVRRLAGASCHPSVVVLSAAVPPQLWQQVTAAGGYDVVRKPPPPGMLDHVIRSATVYWRCRQALDAGRPAPADYKCPASK